MVIERIENNQIKITLSSGVDTFGLQRLIDYVNYLEEQQTVRQSRLKLTGLLMK